MKFSFITPTAYLQEFQGRWDFILALSHLISLEKENDYEKAIKATWLPVWMDNWCFETWKPEIWEVLIKKARKLKAEVIIAPDFMFEWKRTLIAIRRFLAMEWVKDFKVMGVCQSRTRDGFLEFYKKLTLMDWIDMIWLNILTTSKCYKLPISEARVEMMKDLLKLRDVKKWIPFIHKNCHLLWAWDDFKDVLFAQKNCRWINSNDSSWAFWNAIQWKLINSSLEIEGGKTPIRVDFSYKTAKAEDLKRAQQNIDQLLLNIK